jgi:hypothetical protein
MKRSELEHAIRAACDVADDTEVYVFGSQAILGEHPNAHGDLTRSMEADIMPVHHPERWENIDGALGELSPFHETHHFYVQGVSPETCKLPDGWRRRCIRVRTAATNGKTGWCLEGHDLALSKLAAFRPKDKTFVRVLLREKLVRADVLLRRLVRLPVTPSVRGAVRSWIRATAAELES